MTHRWKAVLGCWKENIGSLTRTQGSLPALAKVPTADSTPWTLWGPLSLPHTTSTPRHAGTRWGGADARGAGGNDEARAPGERGRGGRRRGARGRRGAQGARRGRWRERGAAGRKGAGAARGREGDNLLLHLVLLLGNQTSQLQNRQNCLLYIINLYSQVF